MKRHMKGLLLWVSRYKYLITSVAGVLIVGVLDENSFMRRMQYSLQIDDMKKEIKAYNREALYAEKQLQRLRNNPKFIEKIARERYFMKADDEDIFVIRDPNTPAKTFTDDETYD